MSATKELFNAIASRDDASEGASGGGGVEAIRAMLADNPVLATTANEQGISPVMFALYCQKREVATLFLEAGAVPGIFEIVALGELEDLTSRLDADADSGGGSGGGRGYAKHAPDSEGGDTPTSGGDTEAADEPVKRSLSRPYSQPPTDSGSTNPLTARSPDGFTLLHLACFFGHLSCAKLLIERGAEVNIAAENESRVYPIHSAAACDSAEIVTLLLGAGAEADAKQQKDFTALMSAAMHNNLDMARALLKAGANPSQESEDDRTPISMAQEAGHGEMVEMLKKA
ncbi:MAG: ankyrin repeat domain-containing protein [Planctomycetes bacterium]|nr:ankyrin repeat domain-containing protein [Planctomycetota bacterium]